MANELPTTSGTLLNAGTYDVSVTLTTGISKIQRSFDSGETWNDITDASWTASASALLGPVEKALYRSSHTGDGSITVRQVG